MEIILAAPLGAVLALLAREAFRAVAPRVACDMAALAGWIYDRNA